MERPDGLGGSGARMAGGVQGGEHRVKSFSEASGIDAAWLVSEFCRVNAKSTAMDVCGGRMTVLTRCLAGDESVPLPARFFIRLPTLSFAESSLFYETDGVGTCRTPSYLTSIFHGETIGTRAGISTA
jgi:hypothetical protein